MSCSDDPAADEFHLFLKAIKDSCIELEVETGRFHPLARTLCLWADVHDFVSTATWTKKILVGVLAPRSVNEFWLSLGWGHEEGATLLGCFGRAFRGDTVGHVGRDVVEPCLHHENPGIFAAAVGVLEGWMDDDEDGAWQDLLEQHTELEPFGNDQLELQLEGVQPFKPRRCGYGDKIEELVSEQDLADITMGPKFKDPSITGIKRLFELERSGSSLPLEEPELPRNFAAARELSNSCRAVVRHRELPGFLARLLELDPAITLGLLESQKLGTPCVRQSTLEVHVDGPVVRAWNAEMAVSIEPTATSGSWLVFACWPSR